MDGENKMEQYFFTVSAFDALLVFSNPATTTTRGAQNAVFLTQILSQAMPVVPPSVGGLIGAHSHRGAPRKKLPWRQQHSLSSLSWEEKRREKNETC